ncbi:hypothetical protein U6P82_12270, partial [Cutibacterium acnes]
MTNESLLLAAVGLGLLGVALLLVLLLRRPRFETPADLAARLGLLEQQMQALLQTGARLDAGVERLHTRLDEFTAATAERLEASRQTLDAKLDRT